MPSTFFTEVGHQKDGSTRLTTDTERARRLTELRKIMQSEGVEALVVVGRSDLRFRGRVQYVTDIFQFTADNFAVVTKTGEPIFVTTPVVGLGQALLTNWVKDFRSEPEPGREVGKVLSDYGITGGCVGIVGLDDAMAVVHMRELEQASPNVSFQDATRAFESIRQVKSAEEVANLRHTSRIFRKMFGALEAEIRPGIQESDIAGVSSRLAKLHGCKDIKTAMGSSPFRAVSYGSTKRVEIGDLLMVWIETPGPTGYWLELRRSYSFGPAPDFALRYWDVVEKFWDLALTQMKPGVMASDVHHMVEKLLQDNGYGVSDVHYSIHGIGTDAIEGVWTPGNDRILKENEVLSFHPPVTFDTEEEALKLQFLGMTDNILVTANGGERMTYASDSIIEL